MDKKKLGEGRGVIAENPMPDDFDNIKLSKADFVKKQEAKKLKDKKLKEFAKELDNEKKEENIEKPLENAGQEEKPVKKGRPKKII